MKKQEIKDKEKKKGIFARMMEKLDKKLEEKSKKSTPKPQNPFHLKIKKIKNSEERET